jgi:uncharacterized protein
MSSDNLHAPRERLTREAVLLHQAITSLRDAVDWYRQRADDVDDEELKALLLHNMREEMEHASMLLEWIRRFDGDFGRHLRSYLFTQGSIVAEETEAQAAPAANAMEDDADRRFAIGSLREKGANGYT